MAGKRVSRLNEQLKRELAEMIRRDVRDPRVGTVTVTGVDVTRDLSVAKVYVRVPGGAPALAETLEGLAAAAPYLRGLLGRALKVRKVPELRFREDRSMEQALRIEQVLSEVLPEAVEGDGEDGGEDPDAR